MNSNEMFDEDKVLHHLEHYLPAQAPLKDFIHHNTLHAFQDKNFFEAIQEASQIFGYKTILSIPEFRTYYQANKIDESVLDYIILERKGKENLSEWKEKLLNKDYDNNIHARIGKLRANWKSQYKIKLDKIVQANLFRIIGSYLDQGISIWNFPIHNKGFLASVRELDKNSFVSMFKSNRAKTLFYNRKTSVKALLDILVGDESLYEQYLFDQQFTHTGWSGMVATISRQPNSLFDTKKISLKEIVILELLFEIDLLDSKLGENWQPLCTQIINKPTHLFSKVEYSELFDVLSIWQEAFEWTLYDQVLSGMKLPKEFKNNISSFQAIFCIDDRECSLRRHIEKQDSNAQTFGTAGFFGIEFFYQPIGGKFYTKLCPAPLEPKYLIKEIGDSKKIRKDVHFNKHSHSLLKGWIISQSLGFWSALNLAINIFSPRLTPVTSASFRHLDKDAELLIENDNINNIENGLQVGFTIEEMAVRIENLLRSIGLIDNFASLVYLIGHGATSINNTHYAGYDCGACSGRPGSVNAKVAAFMANHHKVRAILKQRGIDIPTETQFVAGLHDTTRDEILFYDEEHLSPKNKEAHQNKIKIFEIALAKNAKERSRRFETVTTHLSDNIVHKRVKKRSVSLFEPRPELNHATNAMCIVGRREISKNIFLDRRSFLNSYDYTLDTNGDYLFGILKAVAPVCGGINLEYFFSRVDNYKLGAGTKLPHNVIGLIGVANGINGDLRPGLPSQMIEVHDPVRLLVVVEHFPEIVFQAISKMPETYEWFKNEWVRLVVLNPKDEQFYVFSNEKFQLYKPIYKSIGILQDEEKLFEENHDNLPILHLN
jgi:uncharacterized protein YbcC (UPF0753/DUF2309 family)